MTKEIATWADESMFKAEKINASEGPKVRIISGPSDPLGVIALTAKAYQGKFPDSTVKISDEDRRYYIKDIQKNALGSPLETVQFTMQITGVTRGFTHQLVRQRVGAAYQQESMRFAVKEDFPVALPPSLANSLSAEERAIRFCDLMGWGGKVTDAQWEQAVQTVTSQMSPLDEMRDAWDRQISYVSEGYDFLVAMGMPAEDARGLAPTNILTKVNYTSSLRGLLDHAGLRLCTQAQYEWKQVWNEIIRALKDYGYEQNYFTNEPEDYLGAVEVGDSEGNQVYERSSAWQYAALADSFRPICYKTGKCEFQSDFDRYCPIRGQVKANNEAGRPSTEWETDHLIKTRQEDIVTGKPVVMMGIPAIRPAQWLDPLAAVKKTTDWRSEENKKNIEKRR